MLRHVRRIDAGSAATPQGLRMPDAERIVAEMHAESEKSAGATHGRGATSARD